MRSVAGSGLGLETWLLGVDTSPRAQLPLLPARLGDLLHRELTVAVAGLHTPGWGAGALPRGPWKAKGLGERVRGGGDRGEACLQAVQGCSVECRWWKATPGLWGIWWCLGRR